MRFFLNFPFFPLFGFSLFLRELPALSHNLVALCALTSILHILINCLLYDNEEETGRITQFRFDADPIPPRQQSSATCGARHGSLYLPAQL